MLHWAIHIVNALDRGPGDYPGLITPIGSCYPKKQGGIADLVYRAYHFLNTRTVKRHPYVGALGVMGCKHMFVSLRLPVFQDDLRE